MGCWAQISPLVSKGCFAQPSPLMSKGEDKGV